MTQSQGNNLFNGSEIQRYHSGQMTAEERHALEKAALDDPFLADALEGYTYTNTAEEDLISIKSRLEEKTTSRKLVFLHSRTWMKVAAVLFVVAGGIWLVMNTQDDSNVKLAVEQELKRDNAENKSSTSDITVADSITKIETFANTDQAIQVKPPNTKNNNKVEKPVETYVYSDATLTNENASFKHESSKESSQSSQLTNPNTQRNDVASGSVTNSRNNAISKDMNRNAPDVNVQNRLANQQVNANRVRSWAESDSIPSGFIAQQRAQSDTVTRMNVIMTPQPSAPLNEVVVSKTVAKKESNIKDRMAGIVIDTLEPAEGWTNFDDYIAGNLKVPDELKVKPVNKGEVELSFDVNQKGEPVNIAVTKSLCTKCDEEAIRLLKQGPKWKKKKNNKGKVTIRF